MKFFAAAFPLALSLLAVFASPLTAQEEAQNAHFIRDIAAKTPKTVVAIFDISKSMDFKFPGRAAAVIDLARPFALDLVGNGLQKGDRFVLYAFDKQPQKLMDATLGENRAEMIAKIPSRAALSVVKGTNIRWAHYEGLKLLEQENQGKRAAYLVVLSDGYHDSPDAGDPNYRDFYIPGRLDNLPDTPDARDYARLARKFKSQNYGVGVQISQNGWVEEKPGAEKGAVPVAAPVSSAEEVVPEKKSNLGALWAGLGALAAALIGFGLWSAFLKPIRVGLGQPADARKNKKFALKHGQIITLGGVGAGAVASGFAIPDTKAPVASIARRGQGFSVVPVLNQPDGAKVFVNGQPLDKNAPLNWGDSVRVDVPDRQAPTISRAHTMRFDRAEAFK